MKMNVKGFIALIAGLLAFLFIIISFMLPLGQINGTDIKFYDFPNMYVAMISVPLGIFAIVMGVLSRKDKDKKGPRKSGLIIGIIAIVLGIIATISTGLLSMVTLYANNPNDSAFSSLSADQREDLDKIVDQLKNGGELDD